MKDKTSEVENFKENQAALITLKKESQITTGGSAHCAKETASDFSKCRVVVRAVPM